MQIKNIRGDQLEPYIGKAKKQAYHMKQLMDDLFEYSYVVGEEFRPKIDVYNGQELMCQILDDLRGNLAEKGFETELYYRIEESFAIRADESQLRRVFDNMYSNINKYASKADKILIDIYVKTAHYI